MQVKVKFLGYGNMRKVGNVWYPDTEEHRKIAYQIMICRYRSFITEKQKMARIYRPTGIPALIKLRLPFSKKD